MIRVTRHLFVTANDGASSYPCVIEHDIRWNGWLVPYFTLAVAKNILRDAATDNAAVGIETHWRFDEERQRFTYADESGAYGSPGEVPDTQEMWEAIEVMLPDGGIHKRWAIGGYSWTWEELRAPVMETCAYYAMTDHGRIVHLGNFERVEGTSAIDEADTWATKQGITAYYIGDEEWLNALLVDIKEAKKKLMALQLPDTEYLTAAFDGYYGKAVTVVVPPWSTSYKFVASAEHFHWGNFAWDERLNRVGYPKWIAGHISNFGHFVFEAPVPLRLSPYNNLYQVVYHCESDTGRPGQLIVRWAPLAELLKQYARR